MSAAPSARPAPVALVGFSGRSEVWWLHGLKPGFRHCLVALPDPRGWILYDPLAHVTQLALLPPAAQRDPFGWLLAQGYLPVPVRLRPPRRRPAPPAPFTCVEAVKRVLGLRAPGVMAPWQLFRHLVRGIEKNP